MASTQAGHASAKRLLVRLSRIRREARLLLVSRRLGWTLAALLTGLALVGLFDFVLRLPAWVRYASLFGAAAGAGWALVRLVWPAWRMSPSLTDLALRLERGRPDLKGRLANATDLARGGTLDARYEPLLDNLSRDSLPDLMKRPPTLRAMGVCLLVFAALATFAGTRPDMASLGAQRVLAPWIGVKWPSRTAVQLAEMPRFHPLGDPLAIRGELTRTDRPVGRTRVEAWYRLDGGTPRKLALTSQGAPANNQGPEVFERLVNPAAEALRQTQRVTMELWLQTRDDRTETTVVELVRPPRVIQASVTVAPPAYAMGASGSRVLGLGGQSARVPLALGGEDTAVLGPVLAGSVVELDLRFNTSATPEVAMQVSDGSGGGRDVSIEPMADGLGAVVRLTAGTPASLSIGLSDELGIASTRPLVIALDVLADADPTAAVLEPSRDEAVLASATLPMVGEGRDDFGLVSVVLNAQRAAPPPGSQGAPPEPAGESVELARWSDATAPLEARAAAVVELARFDLTPGEELLVTTLATDLRKGEATTSAVRRIRIIGQSELVEQLRAEMAAVRESAKRLDRAQSDVLDGTAQLQEVRSAEDDRDLARQQGDLTGQLSRQAQTVREVAERAQRNALDDAALSEMVRMAQDHLNSAADQSDRARASLEEATSPQGQQDPQAQLQSRDQAQRAQERVRDELGGLVGLLSRDEDEWLARRDLDRLIEQQRELQEQTAQAEAQTAGQSLEQLSPQDRSRVEQIAQRQAELARRAQEALDQLADRAQAIAESDPARAETLREAAERGRQGEAPREMRDASQQAQRNQLSSAQQSQQRALDALEDVTERLDEADQDRDQELRRVLAEISAAIEALMARQTTEIGRLEAAQNSRDFRGLDTAMIGLSRDTAALAQDRAANEEALAGIARTLLDAAEAQDDSIVALRSSPINDAEALLRERESLERLQAALDQARAMDEQARQRELQRQRRELRKAYAEALAAQTALRDETASYADQDLSRRQQILVRRLGDRQSKLHAELDQTRKTTEGLAEATAFNLAHARIDRAASRSVELLGGGVVSGDTLYAQDTIATVLRGLIEALDSSTQRGEQEFAQGNQGGQGQGQPGQGEDEGVVPPMAELLLLRTMQVEAAQMTRAIDDGLLGRERLGEASLLQRELSEAASELVQRLSEQQRQQQPQGRGARPPGWLFVRPLGFGVQETPPSAPADQQQPRDDPGTEPTLDELLGLTNPGDVSTRPDHSDLDRELEGGLAGAFLRAVDLMQRASTRLNTDGGTGIATQRVQEEAIAALDQLIEAARNQQSQQQQQQNQQQQQSQQQQQQQAPQQQEQEGNQQQQQQATDDPQGVQGQPQQGGALGDEAAAGATWGALPPRVREALRQGSSDAYSAVYRAITEAYYRRLAEEAGR